MSRGSGLIGMLLALVVIAVVFSVATPKITSMLNRDLDSVIEEENKKINNQNNNDTPSPINVYLSLYRNFIGERY